MRTIISHKKLTIAIITFVLSLFCTQLFSESTSAYEFSNILSDTENWNSGSVGNTDVILLQNKIRLYDATYTITGADKNEFVMQTSDASHMPWESHTNVEKCRTIKWKGPNGNNNISAGTHDIDATINFVYPNAAIDIEDAQKYDVHLTIQISTIRNDHDITVGLPVLESCSSNLGYVANRYLKANDHDHRYDQGPVGTKFFSTVVLKKAGTNTVISNTKRMIWGFSDVDIRDSFNSSDGHQQDYYDSPNTVHPWAEHVTLWNVNTNNNNNNNRFWGPIYTSVNTVLGKRETSNNTNTSTNEDVTLYHEFPEDVGDDNGWNITNNTTDFLVVVNPAFFSYTWQGSNCGTDLVAISGTMYTGHSAIYKGDSASSGNLISSDGNGNNKSLKVQANSQTVNFYHYIHRNSLGPTDDNEEYYVTRFNSDSGPAKNNTSYTSAKSSDEPVYTVAGSAKGAVANNPYSVSLSPGQEKIIGQTLYYQLSNINTKLYNYVDTTCTLTSTNTPGAVCAKLWRPVAKFTGSTDAKISTDNSSTYLDPSDPNGAGDEITEANGNFKIRFGATIKRKASTGTDADEAGGTAATPWSIVRTVNGSNQSGSSGSGNTTGIENNTTYTVKDINSDGYLYTGRLKYGEVRTVCAVLSFDSVVNAKSGNTHASPVEKCVKVWRKPKKCNLNANTDSYEFGVYTGRNLGRIGVANYSMSGSDNFSYTSNAPSSFVRDGSTNNYYTPEASVWARPGDSIRFVQESCAGGAYAVNNSSLSNTTYKTTYTSSGALSTGKSADNSSTGYLFGNAFAGATQTNPLKYPSSVSWDNGGTETDNFPYKENVEFSKLSPAGNSSTPVGYTNGTYNDNPHNQNSYSCININSSKPFQANHYQISGATKNISTASCKALHRTGVTSDVGHTITQTLKWNDVNIINSVDQGTSSHQHIAKASVKVPYNYSLQPAVSANAESNVAYLGSTLTFDIKVITSPRKNIVFGNDEGQNTYATISKPTEVNVKYYFVINGFPKTITSFKKEDLRFNNTGKFDGTENMDNTSYEDGGNRYDTRGIYIDESASVTVGNYWNGRTYNLSVGDKVCADIEVKPADSHNIYSLSNPTTQVEGAKQNNSNPNVALSETGTSSAQRTACYTIAKKPTMSIESSNAFSGGDQGFVTSRYAKHFTSDGTDYIFGSWSEYGVYGNVKTINNRGIASGATFGYVTQNNGVTANQARENSDTLDVAKSDIVHGGSSTNTCVFSTQTFINSDCENGNVGSDENGEKSATDFRKRIYDRFVSTTTQQSLPTQKKNHNDTEGILYPNDEYTWSHGQTITDYGYIRINGESYANLNNWINKRFDTNGINHTYRTGNAYLGYADQAFLTVYSEHNAGTQEYTNENTNQTFKDRNYTRLIEVTGDLILDSNIVVGSNKDANYDSVLNRTGEIVQNIIMAKRLFITSRVTRIDAIVIADEIITCAFSSTANVKDYKFATIGGTGSNTINADTCNNPIHFRGPVVAKKITLNRTYGADKGVDSIKRAEIFELNPYTYLWSYGQMTRYSQAVTTYSRELPTRY